MSTLSIFLSQTHDDLVNSHMLSDNAQREKIPLLAVSVSNSVDRAKALSSPLNTLLSLIKKLESAQWLRKIFKMVMHFTQVVKS